MLCIMISAAPKTPRKHWSVKTETSSWASLWGILVVAIPCSTSKDRPTDPSSDGRNYRHSFFTMPTDECQISENQALKIIDNRFLSKCLTTLIISRWTPKKVQYCQHSVVNILLSLSMNAKFITEVWRAGIQCIAGPQLGTTLQQTSEQRSALEILFTKFYNISCQ